MADYFPEEVVLEVLGRLPVKTVVQCTTVCKAWRSLIKSPDFSTHHLNNYSKKHDSVLLRYIPTRLPENDKKEQYLLYSDENLDSVVTQFSCPFKSSCNDDYLDVVGSVNGLICLSDNVFQYTDRFAIWNPNVRKHVILPRPILTSEKICAKYECYAQVLGFGFDDVKNDYKLVRILYFGFRYKIVPPSVEIYSLKSRCWRVVKNSTKNVICDRQPSVLVNGKSHWPAHSPDKARIGVVSFAYGSENFGKMMTAPTSLDWEDYNNISVGVCNGLLALVPSHAYPTRDCYSVWVMKEYGDVESWSKLYTIHDSDRIKKFVSCRTNGGFMVTRVADRGGLCFVEGELLALDLHPRVDLKHKFWGMAGSFYVGSVLESLVFLTEPDKASEVLLEVLGWLPVKTVVQCTTVCKAWRSLIKSPDFSTHHLNNYSKKHDSVLLRYIPTRLPENDKKEQYLLYSDENLDSVVTQFSCPFKSSCNRYVDVVGSVNGLICLSDNVFQYTDRFAIWNPNVRKLVILRRPILTSEKTYGKYGQVLGFGFDDVKNDYKLVRILYFGFGYKKVSPWVEVYSLKSRCWRMVKNSMKYVICDRQPSVLVNGKSHWLANSPDEDRIGVVSFAYGSENFGKMMTAPTSLDWEDYINMSVGVCNGLLTLVPSKTLLRRDCYSVWVMREYGDVESWSKLYTVHHSDRINKFVSCRTNGGFMVTRVADRGGQSLAEGELLALDLHPRVDLKHKFWGMAGSFYVGSFLESVVLLTEPDKASEATSAPWAEATSSDGGK